MKVWRRVGVAAAALSVAAACALTAGQPAGADNRCPTGCLNHDTPTLITPTVITQNIRTPWMVAKPPKLSVATTV